MNCVHAHIWQIVFNEDSHETIAITANAPLSLLRRITIYRLLENRGYIFKKSHDKSLHQISDKQVSGLVVAR
jgi:hypothetical protein